MVPLLITVICAPANLRADFTAPEVFNSGFGGPVRIQSAEALREAVASRRTLAGADLSGLSLAGADLIDQDLQGTTWTKTDLRGARFTRCDLGSADFSGACLNGAIFMACRLAGANLRGASLAGAYLASCDLSDADFADAAIPGLTLANVKLFPTGAAYLPAVRDAVGLRGGPRLLAAMLGAASGEAFAFTYNSDDRGASPTAPLTSNPVLLAGEVLGYDVTCRTGIDSLDSAARVLTTTLRRGMVAVFPMRLAGAGPSGDAVEQAVWVVVNEIEQSRADPEEVRVQTPFGPMTFGFQDLLRRWRGPWPTLEPAGEAASAATFPMFAFGAQKAETSSRTVAVAALANASRLMNEPRSFGAISGGFEAYEALLRDFADPDLPIGEFVRWSGTPRECLVASRALAAEFLEHALPDLPATAQPPLTEAASIYREVSVLLGDEWPLPGPSAFEGEAAAAAVQAASTRRPHATALLRAVLARERRAMALLEQAVAETVRSG